MGGYDFSGYTNTLGPLNWEYPTDGLTCLTDAVQGGLPGIPTISMGDFKGVLDNTVTTGLHVVREAGAGAAYVVSIAIGDRAAPAEGDPCFCGRFDLDNYMGVPGGGMISAEMKFGLWDSANLINYHKPWGWLLHENSAETGVNSATGIDDYGAATTAGGWMAYHVLAGDGTATLKVQHAATNADGSFADLTGATSGELDCSTRQSGIAQCAVTETVNRYLRWQISLNTATTVTFVLAFIRG
jgi:hypothetical protein